MHTFNFPPEIISIILSFVQEPADLAAWTRVDRSYHLGAVSRLWRGDLRGIAKTQRENFSSFPGTLHLRKLAQSRERFRYYTGFVDFLQLGYADEKAEDLSIHESQSHLWQEDSWKDCKPWGVFISLTAHCYFPKAPNYPFLKPSVRAFIKDLATEHGCTDEDSVDFAAAARDNVPDKFWYHLRSDCPDLEYLVLPADIDRPGWQPLSILATELKSLKLVTIFMRRRKTGIDEGLIPAFMDNPNLLSFCLTYKEDFPWGPDEEGSRLPDILCTNLRVLRMPVKDMTKIKRLLQQLKQLESLHIVLTSEYEAPNTEKEDIVENIIEPLKENPNLVCLNIRNCRGLLDEYKGGNTLAPGDDILALVKCCPKLKSIELELWDEEDERISEDYLVEITEALPLLENLHLGLLDDPSAETLASVSKNCPQLRELHLSTHPWQEPEPTDLVDLWNSLRESGTVFPYLEVIHGTHYTWPQISSDQKTPFTDHERIEEWVNSCRHSMPALMDIDFLYEGVMQPPPPYTSREVVKLLGEALRKENPQWRAPLHSWATRYETAFAEDLLESIHQEHKR